MKIQIQVENIKCGGCASIIRSGLRKDSRIASVEVDIPNDTGTVEASEDMGSAIYAHLEHLGYPKRGSVGGIATVSAKAKSFISCAVGRLDLADERP
jgi:copper chaperone